METMQLKIGEGFLVTTTESEVTSFASPGDVEISATPTQSAA